MKIKMTLKDPDGVYESIREAARKSVEGTTGLNARELERLIVHREEQFSDEIRRWVKYAEYVQIEIDTSDGTACVLPWSETD